MKRSYPGWLGLLLVAGLFSGCGGDDGTPASPAQTSATGRGTLLQSPALRVTTLNAADLTAELSASGTGKQLLQLAGTPKCGVDVYYLQYNTVGGAGEATTASGVMMLPNGAALCSGARPLLLYGHGTTFQKSYNLADVANNSEAALLAAMYTAQGYIVVAPNYAGYDSSTLSYHPYLNADQQAKDMIDSLAAARSQLAQVTTLSESGKVFVSGYSQGGHVAMATARAMQAAKMTLTASAPASGPYALTALFDAVVLGNVNLGATGFAPLVLTSYQKSYSNVYANPTAIYEAAYAGSAEAIVPNATLDYTDLLAQGKLPQALFSSTPPAPQFAAITPPTTPAALAPLFALRFGATNLLSNAFRVAYLQDALTNPDGAIPTLSTGLPPASPASTLRQDLKLNDLRNWVPQAPMLLCGGNADPVVYYFNTQIIQAFFVGAGAPAPLFTVVDVDSSPTGATDPWALVKGGFAQTKAATAQAAVAAGAKDGGVAAVTQAYHSMAAPFCAAAARGFFSQF